MFLARALTTILLALVMTTPALAETVDSLTRVTAIRKDDLATVIQNRDVIRVLVSYNRTNFFMVDGAMRGMEHDLMQEYRKFLAKTHKTKNIRLVFLATPFDQLLPALEEGRGDIVAAGLTITSTRQQQVRFSAPYREDINEIVVGAPKAPPIHALEDLAGKRIHVMAGSSYGLHLAILSKQLQGRGLRPVDIRLADKRLVTEDLLEMTQRSIIRYTVADSHIARLWKTALPDIQLYDDAPITVGGKLGWAVRPDNPEFADSLSEFAKTVRQGTLLGNMAFKRYFVNADWVKNPNHHEGRLAELRPIFEKYGKQFSLDWLKLAALGFQESRLNMDTKSHRGAVGIMQVLPSTATGSDVNIKDYDTADGNIHAGTKYLRYLMDNFFEDVARESRVDFALAAYNAGPYRIREMRKLAKEMGLNPNLWFGNVEYAAYRKIGTETPTYVSNVQMYYAAFKSIFDTQLERAKAK